MQYQTPFGSPQWNVGREQRMFVSMLLATAVVVGVLSVLRLPAAPQLGPIMELIVRIVQPESDDVGPRDGREPAAGEAAPQPEREARAAAAEQPSAPAVAGRVVEPAGPMDAGVDWQAAREQAAREYVESQRDDYGYFDPRAAATRRERSKYYLPPTHPPKKKIWENVEEDQLGRTVLRSGNCFRVLNDPNVGSREKFLIFDQYLPKCVWQKRLPKNLPWVEPIVERYEYLQDDADAQ